MDKLIPWQWSLYPVGHQDRQNLLTHALTVPLFLAGTLLVPLALVGGAGLAVVGPALMVGAMALQGRGHKREATPPVPFRGPLDVLARIFAEQWITFPRFVLSGGFRAAWRAASVSSPA